MESGAGEESAEEEEDAAEVHHVDGAGLVGRVGVAITPLRPAGTGRFDGETIDIVSEGEFIARDARVKIVAQAGARVVVEEVGV